MSPGLLLLTDPLGYIDFLSLTSHARLILTDSGGLQEESTALGIQCLTLRENTERPITVTEGTNQVVGTDTGVDSRGVQPGARCRGNASQAGSLGRARRPDASHGSCAISWRVDVMSAAADAAIALAIVLRRLRGWASALRFAAFAPPAATVLLPVGIRPRGDAGVRTRLAESRYADRARRSPHFCRSRSTPSTARSCRRLSPTVALDAVSAREQYLELTVAMTWKVTGVSWSRLAILPGILFGAVAALTYGVFRLGLSRAARAARASCRR